jgi:hypothetical protein
LTGKLTDSVRQAGALLEAGEVREDMGVDERAQVVAGLGKVVVELACLVLPGGTSLPSVLSGENEGVLLASRAASLALSCSRASRYFRKRSQDDCSL